jgi:threonine aldolase
MKGVSSPRIDLASDTVTKPTPAMREAMARAEVGDDVFGEDPTVRQLEERLAALLGKEDAIFVPSGTMSNQIALRVHCRPGDEVICEASCHILNYEQAGHAQLSGLAILPIVGRAGVLEIAQLEDKLRPDNVHYPVTRLVALENTHNRCGGKILPYDNVAAVCGWAREHGLATHLDGSRLFNAVVATGIPAAEWSQHFDTVNICFSKGLGAPVGSALCGTADAIRVARRHRKLLGGGMRQAGILAAAALYALEHHVDRLAEDHAKAQVLAKAVRQADGLELSFPTVDTNIVIFDIAERFGTAADFCDSLRQQGIRMMPIARQRVRAVTHLDVSLEKCQEVAKILRDLTNMRS